MTWRKGHLIVLPDSSVSQMHQFSQPITSNLSVEGMTTQMLSKWRRRKNIRTAQTLYNALQNFQYKIICALLSAAC